MMRIAVFILLGFWGLASGNTPPLVQGALTQGNWGQVVRLLADTHDTEELLRRGEARRALGYLDAAQADHEAAWRQVGDKDPALKAWAARASAETLLALRRYEEAEQRLKAVPKGCDVGEYAQVALLRGRLEAAQDHSEAARTAYIQARDQAHQAGLAAVSVQAQLGLIDLAPVPRTQLEEIAQEARSATPAYVRVALLMDLAERARRAGERGLAHALLEEVKPQVPDGRPQAEFLALQAALLEDEGHYAEALGPTGEAITEAQGIEAGDLMLHGEWRRGRLYRALDDPERALAALRRAVFHLKTIRSDIPVEYHAGHSSFRETLSPLYLGLTDLLLQQAAQRSEDAAQPLLLEARDTLEQLKAAELQDYLGETCPIETQPVANLEAIAPHTGVLYPILLPDRLELLLGIGNRQYQATVAIKAKAIRAAAEDLAEQLRTQPIAGTSWNHPKPVANQLFTWLIAPLKSRLDAGQVKTLVVVPDGPLRLFPFSTLMDGDTFLIERYAVVTAPSLTLMAPRPLARGGITALVAGMSRPGPVVDEFAAEVMGSRTGAMHGFLARGVRGRGLRGLIPERGTAFASRNPNTTQTRLQDPKIRKMLVEMLALPGVEQEVKKVSQVLGGTLMLNQAFVLNRFSEAMQHPWRVVHVASHGFFGGTPDNSFFMTYDHLLKMGQLEALIEGKGEPPELLTLSACQTAEGNDRAPLGLTGVAVKSGARSALGSLWPVSDDATQLLIGEFYRRLPDPTQTKAQAFQQAQLAVLKRAEFRHPFFWAPFILMGNWL